MFEPVSALNEWLRLDLVARDGHEVQPEPIEQGDQAVPDTADVEVEAVEGPTQAVDEPPGADVGPRPEMDMGPKKEQGTE